MSRPRLPGIEALIGETVRVRLRARDVSIALEKPRGLSIQNVFEGVVREIKEEEGPIDEVKIQVCGEAIIARVTRKAVSELKLSEGKKRLRVRQSGMAQPANTPATVRADERIVYTQLMLF